MWNELIFTIKQTDCDRTSEILTVLNHDGMFIEDFSDLMENDAVKQTNLVEQELLDKISNDPVIHLYISPAQNLSEKHLYPCCERKSLMPNRGCP
jgi:hypothetical protein